MKEIYIVLTHTGTTLSKIIKIFTKDEFSHISISLDRKLTQMYSFGRLHPYNPFWGGFVHEKIFEGTFKRFKNTNALIYSMKVEDDTYKQLEKIILEMRKFHNMYKFNIIGLFAVALKKKIEIKNSFYCAEFVKYVLEESGIETSLPSIVKPEDFKKLKKMEKIYKGKLQRYNSINLSKTALK